jgi:uncharacterized protein (TIGR01244 family)
MDIRQLWPGYAVSPQIAPDDLPALAAAGFRRLVCNRPDGEAPAGCDSARMAEAAAAAGLAFVFNPVMPGAISDDNIRRQRQALDDGGPVLAYCASGNRSSIVWALSQADRHPAAALIAAAAAWGYRLEPFRPQIEALAG